MSLAAESRSGSTNHGQEPAASVERVNIIERGDLVISASASAGGIVVEYLVASQVLWMVSAVFSSMIGPDSTFTEAVELRQATLDGGTGRIRLEDDPTALNIVLLVLHHQYDRVPKTVSFDLMVAIAEICDKYLIQDALRFVAKDWSGHLREEVERLGFVGYENWLLVAWVFGHEEDFTKVSRALVLNGEWVTGTGLVFRLGARDNLGSDYYTLSESVPEVVVGPCLFWWQLKIYAYGIVISTAKLASERQEHIEKIRSIFNKDSVLFTKDPSINELPTSGKVLCMKRCCSNY